MGKRGNARNKSRPRKRSKRTKANIKWHRIKKEEQMKTALHERSPPRDVLELSAKEMSPKAGTSGTQTHCQSPESSPNSSRKTESEYSPSLPATSKSGELQMQRELSDSSDDLPDLMVVTENDPKKTHDEVVPGRRVVNIAHLLKELTAMSSHGLKCTYGRYDCISERRSGIFSELVYRCKVCNAQKSITTDVIDKEEEVNQGFIWGSLSVGLGHSQAEEMMAMIDVPIMGIAKWQRHEQQIEEVWENKLKEYMLANGVREREIAIQKNRLDKDGVPVVMVIVDGGWCSRSYGHAYNAASGVACIIGAETNGLLFIGVRNKYCYVCSNAKPGTDKRDHKCYKNYDGPSTGMEQAILVQGFQMSEEMYGLRYKYMVGDGDASTYARIQRGVKYGRDVVKLECANHMVRNYTDKLHKISKDTSHPLSARKVFTPLIPRLTKAARGAITSAGTAMDNSAILRQDLRNGPHHVFGDHTKCRDTYCTRSDLGEENKVMFISKTTVWPAMLKALDPLVAKADKLVMNVTTNQAERFMGLVTKLSGGKRKDTSKGGTYKRCCLGAGLSHIKGPSWHYSPAKKLFGHSPGTVTKRVLLARDKKVTVRRERLRAQKMLPFSERPVRKKRSAAPADADYGPQAAQPDISEEEMEIAKAKILATLADEVATKEARHALERKTVGQHGNVEWREARKNRLTASMFKTICAQRDHTSCQNNVMAVVNPRELNSDAIRYGRINESKAVEAYEHRTNRKVVPCGLFVDSSHPYLGASPDGLVDDDRVIEVKCLPSVNKIISDNPTIKTIREACAVRKMAFFLNKNGNLEIDRKKNYYYQIQGQLNITQRQYCDLVLYCDYDIQFISIDRDECFWANEMLPKLERFYMECILPEIADPRHSRGMPVREPQFIQDAQKTKSAKEGSLVLTKKTSTKAIPKTTSQVDVVASKPGPSRE